MACPHCGYSYIQSTQRRAKKPAAAKTAAAASPSQKTKTGAETTQRQKRKKPPTTAQRGIGITVYEKGKRVNEAKVCEACKKSVIPVWRFWNTDRGMIYLCQPCAKQVREASRKTDAMDHRVAGDFFRR